MKIDVEELRAVIARSVAKTLSEKNAAKRYVAILENEARTDVRVSLSASSLSEAEDRLLDEHPRCLVVSVREEKE